MRVASFEETRQMRGARDRDSAIIAGRAELEARKSALDQRRVEEELVYIYQGTDCSEYTGVQSFLPCVRLLSAAFLHTCTPTLSFFPCLF